MFYELLSVVSFGIRPLLDPSMDLINATEPESPKKGKEEEIGNVIEREIAKASQQ